MFPVPRSSTVSAFAESSLVNPYFSSDSSAFWIAAWFAVNDSPDALICAARLRCATPASRAALTRVLEEPADALERDEPT